MSRQDMYERVVASLQDTTLDESLWPTTSALIDEACGGTGNGLVVCEPYGENPGIVHAGFFLQGEPCEELQRQYVEVYHRLDERVPRLHRLPDSQLVSVSSLFTEEEMQTSPVYNEWLLNMGAQNGLNVRLDGPAGCQIFWGTADPFRTADWGAEQIAMLKRLLPHIRYYVSARRALVGARALTASLTELLDNARVGIIHLDLHGRIVEVNNRAHDILHQSGGLFENKGFLSAWLPAENAALQKLLAEALHTSSSGPPTGGVTAVRRASSGTSLLVHVDPVTAYRKGYNLGGLGAMVLVVDPLSQPRIDPVLVARVLGLTPGESRVAAMLAEGRTVRDIALVTGRKKSTVYWLLREVYAKLGISRQVDLVRMVLSLADLSGSQA